MGSKPKLLAAAVAVAYLIAAASAQARPYDKGDLRVLACSNTELLTSLFSGNTGSTFNIGLATGPGPDHWWQFSLDQQAIVTLESCGAWFSSAVGFYNRAVTEPLATGVSNCANGVGGTVTTTLEPGDYSMIVEGATANDRGPYTASLTCELPGGTSPSPPTPAPTSPPTPLSIRPSSECPDGYGDYGTRFDLGIGRVTIIATHEECTARCTQYSGVQYTGGCRAYQTGMYWGSLYCRSYGGSSYSTACAGWAFPTNPGMYSGALNTIHQGTGQRNIGGSCCTNNTWLAATGNVFEAPDVNDDDNDNTVAAASSSSTDSASSNDVGVAIAITLGVMIVLYGTVMITRHYSRAESNEIEGASTTL